jgi:hypothetical protein
MKRKLSTIFAAGTLALALSVPALAGPVGLAGTYSATSPDPTTIAELEHASKIALREGRDGNKNNPAFTLKSSDDLALVARLQSGQQVDQKQIDDALQPVSVW